jgi:hypothetical protein
MGRDLEFESATPYTLLAYGFGTEPIEVVQIDDSQIDAEANSPTLRLINASVYGETSLGLGYALVETASQEPSLFSESPAGELNRQSLAFGIERVPNIEAVLGRENSDVGLAARSAVDIYVIDESLQMIARIVRSANLTANGHYDVVAFQNRDSTLIEGFAVRYPGG